MTQMAGILDDIARGAASAVNPGTSEVRALIQRFARAQAAAEANYAKLVAHNNWRKENKVYFKTTAERDAFQKLLDEGREVVTTGRQTKATLVSALKAIKLNPADYGLGFLSALVIPGAVAYAIYKSVGVLESWTKKTDPAVSVSALVASGVPPAEAVKLNNDALRATAEANKGTLDRVLDNLPLLLFGGLALMLAPRLVEMFKKAR